MTTIVLPWPPKGLQPHAKGNWQAKATATKAYRWDAFALARKAGVACDPLAVMFVNYFPPDNAPRDAQNMHGQIKPAIDGIADAMGCDDRGFQVYFAPRFSCARPGGEVRIEIINSSAAADAWQHISDIVRGMVRGEVE